MKKIIWGVAVVVILWAWAFYAMNWNTTLDTVSANPDFICKKAVTEQPCELTDYPASCSEWDASWNRTCPWKEATEVSYYLIRTNCESGYTKVAKGWNVWGNSGRQEWDYVSNTKACEVIESDHVAPTGEVN